MQETNMDFFASANSGAGFINYFGNIFSDLNRLYIIKGGSGTGKSSFMKKIADTAMKDGMNVEYFHCSSDPESLDGIIIDDLKIGFIDGTAPHTADPKCPGAYDEILNVGDFWDKEQLINRRSEIEEISAEKALLFDEVYRYLSAAHNVQNTIDTLCEPSINTEKMYYAVKRICKTLKNEKKGDKLIRITEGITMDGAVSLNPFTDIAEKVYAIRDKYSIYYKFFNFLEDWAKQENISHTISYDPLDPSKINMMYFPTSKTLFYKNASPSDKEHVINTERFIILKEFKKHRGLIRYANKCKKELLGGAYDILSKIKEKHFELESIYINAMDFAALNKFEENVIKEIFG